MSLIIATGVVAHETITEAENSPLSADTGSPIISDVEEEEQLPADIIQIAFHDVLPGWAEQSIQDLNQQDIIQENENGNYESEETLTRGEFIMLINKILVQIEFIVPPQNCRQYYTDVRPGNAAYSASCTFWQKGWSIPSYRFYVDTAITRGEAAEFVYQVLGSPLMAHWNIAPVDIANEGELFTDVSLFHDVFYESALMNRADIMSGYADGLFRPDKNLNRAEAAVVLHRALETIQKLQLRFY